MAFRQERGIQIVDGIAGHVEAVVVRFAVRQAVATAAHLAVDADRHGLHGTVEKIDPRVRDGPANRNSRADLIGRGQHMTAAIPHVVFDEMFLPLGSW